MKNLYLIRRIALLTVLSCALFLLFTGCNEKGATDSFSDAYPMQTSYGDSPEEVQRLFDDHKRIMDKKNEEGVACHFTIETVLNMTTDQGETQIQTRSEGDKVLPHSTKQIKIRKFSKPKSPNFDFTRTMEEIVVGGRSYVRLTDSDTWTVNDHESDNIYEMASHDSELAEVVISKKMMGLEDLPNQPRLYHIQLVADSEKIADWLKKKYPESVPSGDALQMTLTMDMWISPDDLLAYKVVYNSSFNERGGLFFGNMTLTEIYSDWGESMEINAPCNPC